MRINLFFFYQSISNKWKKIKRNLAREARSRRLSPKTEETAKGKQKIRDDAAALVVSLTFLCENSLGPAENLHQQCNSQLFDFLVYLQLGVPSI